MRYERSPGAQWSRNECTDRKRMNSKRLPEMTATTKGRWGDIEALYSFVISNFVSSYFRN
ncbi:MAG: hypothetical protein PHS59_00375 [Paludibacter sp.]|nr:hypothetical protein [Paludibacter sp.]